MEYVPRNASCPCRSGRKFKRCCGRHGRARRSPESPESPESLDSPLETIDATGRGCRWTIFEKGDAGGQFVEHACTGDRFEVSGFDGWLHNGKVASMLFVLELLPPQLIDWALRQALEAVSDEELTPLGVEVARVILLAVAVTDLVGDPRRRRRRGLRRRAPDRQAAA